MLHLEQYIFENKVQSAYFFTLPAALCIGSRLNIQHMYIKWIDPACLADFVIASPLLPGSAKEDIFIL